MMRNWFIAEEVTLHQLTSRRAERALTSKLYFVAGVIGVIGVIVSAMAFMIGSGRLLNG
jgi:hypothetical protein